MSLEQGIHDGVPMADYIADAISPEPSLSTGVAQALIERTPLHAWHEHPRLGGAKGDQSPRADLGSAVHTSILGGAPIEYVNEVVKLSGPDKGLAFVPTDWATKSAQEQRDAIYARGAIPMLPHQRATIEAATANAKAVLAAYGDGKAEQTLLCQYRGVWLRGRADYLTGDGQWDIDVKTVDNADPASWVKRVVFAGGLDIQAAIRCIGHEEITGRTRGMLWLLVEIEPPYAACVVAPGPAMLELAQRKVELSADRWRKCLAEQKWPGYRTDIHWADLPSYVEYDFEARRGAA